MDELEGLVQKSKIVYDEIENLLPKIDKLRSALRKINPPSPKRFKPTDNQREKLFDYSSNYHKICELIEQRYQKAYGKAKEKLKEKELLEEFESKIKNYTQEFKKIKSNFDQRIKKITRSFVSEIETLNKAFLLQFESHNPLQSHPNPDQNL